MRQSDVNTDRPSTEGGLSIRDTGDPHQWRIDKPAIISQLQSLPTMPQIIVRAEEIIKDSRSGMKALSDVLGVDPGMVARILKLANSAYYGLAGRVHSLPQACVLLGTTILREVVVTAGLSGPMENQLPGYGYAAKDLWHHSIAVARCARNISRIRFPDLAQEVYIAGIIHDSGKIVLDPYVLRAKSAFDAYLSADPESTFLDAEISILGCGHAEIALDVCRKWHIPESICEAVGFHHNPSLSKGKPIAYMIHMADHIARSCGFGYGIDDLLYQAEKGAAEFLGLEEVYLNELKAQTIEDMLQLDG